MQHKSNELLALKQEVGWIFSKRKNSSDENDNDILLECVGIF